jgi:hypothetical protein
MNPTPAGDNAQQELLAEKEFVALYSKWIGATEAQARSVYMYADIAQHRDAYCLFYS